ncbi:MAG: FmdB family transcriptional regulator [Chloroflexi bacterium]|nr:FmdB family transcriptional regulator [Chloroflexota bacterium]HCH36272.1 FmdB family transcriptional regulator [Dehalococcoidia bacterium]
MPLYEYVCRSCQSNFEKRLPMASSSIAVGCPECGTEAVKTFSMFASNIKNNFGSTSPLGGCCGGSCGCG